LKAKKFTNAEMLRLKSGTLVRIKTHVRCDSIYKKGGELVFQPVSKMEDDERQFGILVEGFGVNFTFSCNDYELIEKKLPLNKAELERLSESLKKHPKWIKAEKEDDAKQLILWFAEDNNLKFDEIQTYQFRLTKDDLKLDIFPLSKKYHDIKNNERGLYKELLSFLCSYFQVNVR
jgi:hypothetical protein